MRSLRELYILLNNSNVRYFVVGRFEYNLDETGDIDICLHHKDYDLAESLVYKFAEKFDLKCIKKKVAPGIFLKKEAKFFLIDKETPNKLIELDLWCNLHWRSFTYLTYNKNYITYTDNIPMLANGLEAYIGAIKDILYGKHNIQKRIDVWNSGKVTLGCNNCIKQHACQYIGGKSDLVISLLKNKKIDAKIIRQVRKLFFISSLKRSIMRQFGQSFKYALNILILPFNARNESMLVTFQGPDGSGKTSAIESFLSSNFRSEIFPNYMVMHTRPKIIPPLGSVFKAFKKKQDPRDFNLRSTSELGYLRSNVYPLYYLIDFLSLYLIKLIYFKRGGTIIILDRYFYEYMYQQEFSHCNKAILRVLSKIIPTPDINFIFKASAKVIHHRKDELSESEIDRQITSLKSVFSTVNNSIWIDTEAKKIAEVAGEVAFTIASNQKKL